MKFLIAAILFLCSMLYAKENKKVILQLNWLHQFQFAGYYMAKEKGYYKDAGIDLKIKEFSNDTDLIEDVEKGEADFAIGRSSLMIDRSKGADIVALAAIYQSSPLMLLVLKSSGIEKIEDLKNRNIMITQDAKSTASIMAMLSSKGVTKDNLNIQPHSFDIIDLIEGNTDAMASYISNEPIILKEKSIEYRIFHPKDHGFDFYSDILFTSSKQIKENPELTKAFYKATIKGWEYAFGHIAETAEVIYKKYNTKNKRLISLVKEGEALKTLIYHNRTEEIGCLDRDKLADILNVYKVMGFIQNEFEIDDFIYNHNKHNTIKLKFSHNELYNITATIFLIFVLFITFIFYFMIKNRWLHTTGDLKKEIERQKVEIEKQNRYILAQARVAAVSEMLQNIAHQWRQPLSIITTAVSNLKIDMELNDEIDAKTLNETVDIVIEESTGLSETINNFSSFFNKYNYLETYTLDSLLEEIDKIYGYDMENLCINYIKKVDKSIELDINKGLFIEAFMVIYKNSFDAFVNKDIDERSRYIFLKVKKNNGKCIITFKDSAGGIKEESIEKIFEPYFTTKHKSIGTGIGLYMTHQIITKHFSGTIAVENVKYNYKNLSLAGAKFTIVLPLDI